MQSKAATVAEYLKSLPEDRRKVVAAVRRHLKKHIDPAFAEEMQYGMIGYCVPLSKYKPGYHAKPGTPLPFAAVAAQKNNYAIYLMHLYGDADALKRFKADWKKSGKKLDMGKSCIRFRSLAHLDLDAIANSLSRVTLKKYVSAYEAARPAK